MGIRDELRQLKKTPQEYAQEQQAAKEKEYRDAVRQYGERLIELLQRQMKVDAQRGQVSGNQLSGTLRIDNNCYILTSKYFNWNEPKVEHELVRRGFGWTSSKLVWRYDVSAKNEIFDILDILKQYAQRENITLSKLYFIDSNNKRYRGHAITTTSEDSISEFYYAVDYSITL